MPAKLPPRHPDVLPTQEKMPRPKTKPELLFATTASYEKLLGALDALTDAERVAPFPFEHRDKNIRDVLGHLHAWQQMMLSWYEVGMSGSKPDMPAKGYTWKTTPELNAVIWAQYQNTSLKQVRSKLQASHQALHRIMSDHLEAELFTKRFYDWTGTTSLGSYLISATVSHYEWATKLIRRFSRALQQAVE